ncbi:arginase family protein [Leifsonia sp. YIM 134122]|uniref:Arginase family protein n=1 Tax=Leifsonia stereocauli TaxID=3134136 RepID=A0ABU9W384_9MICO
MPATFIVVPQWQGSVSARAMRLIDGADAIRGDLPSAATRSVEVPIGAGEALETGISRFSSVLRVRDRLRETLTELEGPTVVIGGDCAVSLAAVERAAASGDDLAVIWFDAHPDLNTPESSPSGGFGGMVLRTLLGDGAPELVPPEGSRVLADRLVLGGVRDVDLGEELYIAGNGIRSLTVDELSTPDALVAALQATGASRVYVHIDLDVLDPAAISGLDYPEPFGLSVETLTTLIGAVRSQATLVGATIAGFAPATPTDAADDLPAILRIIGSLTRG